MESNKQSLQISVSPVIFCLQSRAPESNRINLTQFSATKVFQYGLTYCMVLVAAIFSAILPVQANQGFVDPAPFKFTHAKKNSGTEDWVKGRILVMPRAGLPKKALDEILKEHDGKARKIGQSDLYIVDLPEYSEEGAVTKLKHHQHLKFAELDHIALPAMIPNDYYYSREWHLSKIGALSAWDISQGEGVTIAILDSGVDLTHPDLIANLVPGWNFYDNNSNTADVIGHGTFVAGAAAAITNNSIGVASIAGKAKIMPLRVSDINGYGYTSTISSALIHAADHGVRVANISFRDQTSKEAVRTASQYMKDKNGLVVTSGDNSGVLENYTATTTMISVSATDEFDQKTDFSSYGTYITLAAPGTKIWSTGKGGGYGPTGGTSISSPVTGGVIAMMMSANPNLKSTEIENLLFSTALDLGEPGRDPYFGYGRVDAAAAVQAAKTAIPIQDIEAPTVSIIDPLEGAAVSGLVSVDIGAIDNVGVARAELWINNTNVAIDASQPFAFTWDSSGASNGTANLEVRAFDAAGNISSSSIYVNVDNPVPLPTIDTESPAVQVINPVDGNVSGSVNISINASDNNGASGISLSVYIDGVLKAIGTGSTLGTSWNTRSKGVKAGAHTIQAVAKDAAGNTSISFVTVNVVK